MAITIITQPTGIQPVYNNAAIVVSSDLSNQHMFKYKFETYVNEELINTVSLFPRQDGTAIFDASKIVKNYVENNFNPLLTTYGTNFTNETNIFYTVASESVNSDIVIPFMDNVMTGGPSESGIGFLIDTNKAYLFVEGNLIRVQQDIPYTNPSYNTTATVIGVVLGDTISTVYTDIPLGSATAPEPGNLYVSASSYIENNNISETSNILFGVQLSADWEEAKNISAFNNIFIPNNTSSHIFGTRTDKVSISSTSKKILSYFTHNFSNRYVKTIKLTTTTGRVFTKTVATTVIYTAPTISHFPIGLTELNALTWTSGTGTITDADFGFTVEFLDASNVAMYHPIEVTLKCTRFEDYTICYKSVRGSYWYIDMNMKNTKVVDITSSNYQHYVPYNYNYLSRGYSTNNLYAKGKITLRTNWINSNDEIDEIIDMTKSPEIYLLKDGIVLPVSIVPGSFEHKNKDQDNLVAYEITFNEDFDKNTTI